VLALLTGATRELLWGLPAVARELHRWKSLAGEIPDAPLRDGAMSALEGKRGQAAGAALFTILPRARNLALLRLLVAFQTIWDFLDEVSERGAAAGHVNGRQLHLALIDALDPARPISDYYRHSPWREDGGYLNALVAVCRECCVQLPSYERIRPLALREAGRAQVLALNHDLDPLSRDAALKAWCAEVLPDGHEAKWYELTGAASAGLTIIALLTLASEPACSEVEIDRTYGAYFPWASALAAMLDSYVDEAEDLANGDHIYISHYPTHELAERHICLLVQRSLREAHTLKRGEKHVLIIACMVAMYLSKDSARIPAMRRTSSRIVDSGGSLSRVLLPILRLWRIAYAQRST
jgi:tetraprenyl-beta-curcumene synthase